MRTRAVLLLLAGSMLFANFANAELIHHRVQPGETLQKISWEYFGTTRRWFKMFSENRGLLETPDSLEPGMVIAFEGPKTVTVAPKRAEPAKAIAAKQVPQELPKELLKEEKPVEVEARRTINVKVELPLALRRLGKEFHEIAKQVRDPEEEAARITNVKLSEEQLRRIASLQRIMAEQTRLQR